MSLGRVLVLDAYRQTSGDWGASDLGQFHRAATILRQAGLPIEMETGLSDEGEPWCVFCHGETGEVFVHFARIGWDYVVAAPFLNRQLTGRDFGKVMDDFLVCTSPVAARTLLAHTAQGGGSVYLHPFAMLTALIAVCYLSTEGNASVDLDARAESPGAAGSADHPSLSGGSVVSLGSAEQVSVAQLANTLAARVAGRLPDRSTHDSSLTFERSAAVLVAVMSSATLAAASELIVERTLAIDLVNGTEAHSIEPSAVDERVADPAEGRNSDATLVVHSADDDPEGDPSEPDSAPRDLTLATEASEQAPLLPTDLAGAAAAGAGLDVSNLLLRTLGPSDDLVLSLMRDLRANDTEGATVEVPAALMALTSQSPLSSAASGRSADGLPQQMHRQTDALAAAVAPSIGDAAASTTAAPSTPQSATTGRAIAEQLNSVLGSDVTPLLGRLGPGDAASEASVTNLLRSQSTGPASTGTTTSTSGTTDSASSAAPMTPSADTLNAVATATAIISTASTASTPSPAATATATSDLGPLEWITRFTTAAGSIGAFRYEGDIVLYEISQYAGTETLFTHELDLPGDVDVILVGTQSTFQAIYAIGT